MNYRNSIMPVSLICLFLFGGFIKDVHGQQKFENNIIYIVRHAEKQNGNDPALTREGEIRSGNLMRRLQKLPPQIMYVSQFNRSAMTADSLRIQMHIDTIHYIAEETGAELVNKMDPEYKTILIIAHSNTIPSIIKKLGVQDEISIADTAYDDLFIVTFKNGKIFFKKEKYGIKAVNKDPMIKPL